MGTEKALELSIIKYNDYRVCCEKIIDLKYKNAPYAFSLNVISGINRLEDIDAIKLELEELKNDFKEMKKYGD